MTFVPVTTEDSSCPGFKMSTTSGRRSRFAQSLNFLVGLLRGVIQMLGIVIRFQFALYR